MILKVAVMFTYDDSMYSDVQKKCEVLLGGVNSLHLSAKQDCADETVSKIRLLWR